jgi:uncharacterized protein (DUF1330 family)
MTVYIIIDLEIIDETLYAGYVDRVYDVVTRYGGQYLVRGGGITPVSGNWHPQRMVIIAFPQIEDLRACFNSPAYQDLAPLREKSTVSQAIVVEGYES